MTDDEVRLVCESFTGKLAARDRALFLLGRYTGFRITELLSLRIRDVWTGKRVVDQVTVQRRHMKRKREGRTVRLHPEAAIALQAWLNEMRVHGQLDDDRPLFQSGRGVAPIGRIAAWRRLQRAYHAAGLSGQLGTHAMRKTFANGVYERLGHDVFKTQRALGHANFNSTLHYLSFREEDIDEAILSL